MIKGALLSDAIVILSSLNVIAGELDINYNVHITNKK
jgi:NADH:ubiquinone oxidoreductase subunit D